MMFTRLLQTFAAWAGIGYALHVAGLALTDALFWCIVILIWVVEYLARVDGRTHGILLNGMAVMNLKEQVDELTEKLNQYEQHSSTGKHEQQNL